MVLKLLFFNKWDTTMAKVLVDCIFEGAVFNGPLWDAELLEKCRQTVQARIFIPWRIQSAIDLGGCGSLNYGGLKILNDVDPLPPFSRKSLPSNTTIQKTARQLESYASTLIPFQSQLTTHGPLCHFLFEPLVWHLVKSFSLERYARADGPGDPLEIAGTLDGAQLTDNINHLLGGFKIFDKRAVDPLTNTPLFLKSNYQSRDHCFPAIMLLSKDTSEVYETTFKIFFDFLKLKCKIT